MHTSSDQIDTIVINELRDAIDRNLILERDEGGYYMEPDAKLIESFMAVLKYYMPVYMYEVYSKSIALKRMALNAELLGLTYD